MSDTIFMQDYRYDWTVIPVEPASDPDYVKHVVCEGARFHVISYSNLGRKCSEPNCIINKPIKEKFE